MTTRLQAGNVRAIRPLSPSTLVAAAQVLVGLGESFDAASAGFIDVIRQGADLGAADGWDLAFVHHVGWYSHGWRSGQRSAWPFARRAGHDEVAAIARRNGLIADRPCEGDLVLYRPAFGADRVRAAIVLDLEVESSDPEQGTMYHCFTIEGDVRDRGARTGGVRRCETMVSPGRGDLVIRWTWSDNRQARIDTRGWRESPRVAEDQDPEGPLARCA